MTTFDTNARTDLNSRGRLMMRTLEAEDRRIWRLTEFLPTIFFRPLDPEAEIAKAERREAARRATDNLLLR